MSASDDGTEKTWNLFFFNIYLILKFRIKVSQLLYQGMIFNLYRYAVSHKLFNSTNHLLLILFCSSKWYFGLYIRCRHEVVITTVQLPSTKSERKFCTSSNAVRGMLEIYNGENLWSGPDWNKANLKSVNHSAKTIHQFIVEEVFKI